MDRLKALEVFVTIADLGSFTRAATRLRLSPAMATTHINRLEEQLGVRLIARTTRRLALTEQGERFLADARHILHMLAAAEGAARDLDRRPAGRVRIDAPASLGTLFLLPALAPLKAAYPDIVIDLTLGDRGTLFRSEGFDIIVRVGDAPHSERIEVQLGETRFILVAAPAYLARRGVPETPEALLDHDCILYSSVEAPGGSSWRFLRDRTLQRIGPPASMTFNDGRAITAAAIDGHGIAQNLDMLVREPIGDGRLVTVLDRWFTATAPVMLISPRDRHQLAAVRAVMEFLADGIDWGLVR